MWKIFGYVPHLSRPIPSRSYTKSFDRFITYTCIRKHTFEWKFWWLSFEHKFRSSSIFLYTVSDGTEYASSHIPMCELDWLTHGKGKQTRMVLLIWSVLYCHQIEAHRSSPYPKLFDKAIVSDISTKMVNKRNPRYQDTKRVVDEEVSGMSFILKINMI